jgi:hypothetical protein
MHETVGNLIFHSRFLTEKILTLECLLFRAPTTLRVYTACQVLGKESAFSLLYI